MSELEKLYEIAGVKGEFYATWSSNTNVALFENLQTFIEYPSFTEDKQLKLIKLICQKAYSNYDFSYVFVCIFQKLCNSLGKSFEESLCFLINELWWTFSDFEQKQIKEILL